MMDQTQVPDGSLIRIVIGPGAGGLYWEGIKQLLRSVSQFRVIAVAPGEELVSLLEVEQPHVLITDFRPGVAGNDFEPFRSVVPDLAIIVLDPSGDNHSVDLRDMGRDLLIDIIRDIGADCSDRHKAARTSFLFVTADGVVPSQEPEQTAQEKLVTAPPPPEPYRTTAEHLSDLFRWLDLVLLGELTKFPAGVDDAGSMGWTMQVEKARTLLGAEPYGQESAREYQRARVELEREMQARFDAIAASDCAEAPKMIDLSRIFALDAREWLVLVFALAAELDGRYAQVFGFLNDDLTRKRPTSSLIAHILPGDRLSAPQVYSLLKQNSPLALYHLISLDPDEAQRLPGSEVGLVPAAELTAFLLASDTQQPSYQPAIQVVRPLTAAVQRFDDEAEKSLRDAIRNCLTRSREAPLIHLMGDGARRYWFEQLLGELDYTVVRLDVALLPDIDAERIINAAVAAARVALLHDAVLLITGFAQLPAATDAVRLNDTAVNAAWPLVSVLATDGPLSVTDRSVGGRSIWQVHRPRPAARVRAALWCDEARRRGFALAPRDALQVARTFGFDKPQIAAAVSLCGRASTPDELLTQDGLKAAARSIARQSVPPTVRRIEAIFGWHDIILPDAVKEQLRQIPQHVLHSEHVLGDWGFASRLPYGQGVAALFSGPSGTGKTMAAQIIARHLGVELYQVDLAKTVSKYIGETEKNLELIFDAAERANAVLLFDEADSLFGKRSEVKDAHDRYANVEVAYLLQRMEAYAGVAILTTNMKQNLDTGFIRRLRFFIEFPPPDAEDREKIWKQSIPPLALGGESLDFRGLARRLAVTGGHIQQIAVGAAFAAATEHSAITMQHILQATRQELSKLGMLNAERSLADLAA